jgi:hypothetical protein
MLSFAKHFDSLSKQEQFKMYLLRKNDLYGLGLSIQYACGVLFPDVDFTGSPGSAGGKVEEEYKQVQLVGASELHRESGIYVKPPHGSVDSKLELKFQDIVDMYDINSFFVKQKTQSHVGGGDKNKRYVLGKLRKVFKKSGQGNTLFIKFHGKHVPLKDAKMLEKRLKKLKELKP